MNLTEEQSRAIAARGQVIVSASAGSGKTFVMIERLVSLIVEGHHVRDMLAVTFTNKAAAQMRDRLRLALLRRIGESTGRLREHLSRELADLPVMDVSTIHAFCGRLVRANFFLLDIDPAFTILSTDTPEGKSLSAQAMDEVFERAYEEGNEDFSSLLSVYFRKKKDVRLRGIVLSLYDSVREEADYRAVLRSIGRGDRFDEACDFLMRTYRERARFLAARLDDWGAYFAEHNPRALSVSIDLMQALTPLLSAETLFGMAAHAQETELSVATMPRMTKAVGEELERLRFLSGAVKAVKALYAELREYAPCERERERYLDAERRAAALASLALAYDDVFTRIKRENNVLDYHDLEQFALDVLGHEEVRGELRGRYRFVCVDEYQDVNPMQERILAAVSGEDVFLVGDEKQAIYGFRGSRSEYFEQKIAETQTSLRLTRNFRSSDAVLDGVNRVFAPLLGEKYVPMRGGGRYGTHRGAVRFHLLPAEEKAEKAPRNVYSVLSCEGEEEGSALAREVAALVERELGTLWYDADAGCEKRVIHGDIAVLVRKNAGDAERIAHELVLRGIPVTTSSRANVCDFFEARLLIDWLSYLDNAEQDVPLVTAMLSKLGNFTERELAAIRLSARSEWTFRDACKAYRKQHADTPIGAKLAAFDELCEGLRALSRLRSASEMAVLLLSMGLEQQIAAGEDGEVRLSRVRRLVAEAETAGSVHHFLTRLADSGYRVEYSGSGGENAVHILTMHAAKGLEFPVVILTGMDALFHGADKDELIWTEKFRAAPRSYDAASKTVYETVLRRAARAVQEGEERVGERNLLYVAMTRARDRLHLFFTGKDRALSPDFAKRFSDFIDFTACASCFADREAPTAPIPRETAIPRGDAQTEALIRAHYRAAYPFEASTRMPLKSSATALMHGEEQPRPASAGTGGGYSVETGLAYHAFLEHFEFGKDAAEELARMRGEGVLNEEQLALLDVGKLREIVGLPSLAALAGRRVWREYRFLLSAPARDFLADGTDDEVIFQGAIDLLAEEEGGYRIFDYKFSARSDEEIRAAYALQIALYRRAVACATGTDERNVKARILNIAQGREIEM